METYVKKESLALLYESSVRAVPFNIFISTLLALDMWYINVPVMIIFIWWLAILLISLLRLIHLKLINAYALAHYRPQTTFYIFMILTFSTGAIWGISYFIFLPYVNVAHEVIIILVLGGMCAGSISSLAAFLPAFYSYILPMFLPLIAYNYISLDIDRVITATMFLLFVFGIMLTSKLNAKLILKTITLDHKRAILFDKLKSAHKELADSYKEIQKLSNTDGLTSLSNRRYYDNILDTEWNRARRYQREISLLMIDVDNFKTINDKYGHPAGDDYLKEFAKILKQNIKRASDTIARIGGDEFAVILPDTPLNKAQQLAQIIKNDVAEKNQYKHEKVNISIGISSEVPNGSNTPQDLVKKSDTALYTAKQKGKNSIACR